MSDSPRTRTVLVTGSAKRLGREIALALAAGGWQVAVHYRGSAEDAGKTVADCRKLAGAGALIESFQADLDDEAQARALLPRVVAALRRRRCRRQQRLASSSTTRVKSFGYEALLAHMRTNTGAPVLLAQALHEHVCQDAAAHGRGGQPARPEAVEPESRTS